MPSSSHSATQRPCLVFLKPLDAHLGAFLQQPYSNGQLPNLTIRKEMLALMLMLPVQVDHLKRSGIGKVVMGLINCKEVGHSLVPVGLGGEGGRVSLLFQVSLSCSISAV